jgi:hypothetical protein
VMLMTEECFTIFIFSIFYLRVWFIRCVCVCVCVCVTNDCLYFCRLRLPFLLKSVLSKREKLVQIVVAATSKNARVVLGVGVGTLLAFQ